MTQESTSKKHKIKIVREKQQDFHFLGKMLPLGLRDNVLIPLHRKLKTIEE